MKRICVSAVTAALLGACGGGGDDALSDHFASCNGVGAAAGCKITFSGAFTGTADCTESDGPGAGSNWILDLSPVLTYPSGNASITLSNTPTAPGTYSMSQMAQGFAQVSKDSSTYWLAAGPISPMGDLNLKLTQVSGGFHGAVAATLVPGSQGAVGNVTLCATF